MISHVLSLADWDVLVDDDGAGEIADIVGLRSDGPNPFRLSDALQVFSGGQPRAQVEDLYAVCGQAQKSVRRRRDPQLMIDHLIRREKKRLARTGRSGFMHGSAQRLYVIADNVTLLRPDLTIAIAQPGLAISRVSSQQLELLASTEVYVFETARSAFEYTAATDAAICFASAQRAPTEGADQLLVCCILGVVQMPRCHGQDTSRAAHIDRGQVYVRPALELEGSS